MRKNFVIVTFVTTFIMSIVYACSAGQNDWEEDLDNSMELKTAMARGAKNYTRVDSIAESDEFLDYAISMCSLLEKLGSYISQMSEEDYKVLKNNIENEEYISDLWERADVNSLYEDMVLKRDILECNTIYLSLTDEEQALLAKEIVQFRYIQTRKIIDKQEAYQCQQTYELHKDVVDGVYARAMKQCKELSGDARKNCEEKAVTELTTMYEDINRELRECLEKCEKKI